MKEIKKTIIINAKAENIFSMLRKVGLHLFENEIIEKLSAGELEKIEDERTNPLFIEEIIEEIPNEKLAYKARLTPLPNFPTVLITWKLKKINENQTQVNVIIDYSESFNSSTETEARKTTSATLYVTCPNPTCKEVIKQAKKLPTFVDAYRITPTDDKSETDVIVDLLVESEQDVIFAKNTLSKIKKVKEVIPEISTPT